MTATSPRSSRPRVAPCEALVLQSTYTAIPRQTLQMTRNWSDEEWQAATESLAYARLGGGRRRPRQCEAATAWPTIERRTDELATRPVMRHRRRRGHRAGRSGAAGRPGGDGVAAWCPPITPMFADELEHLVSEAGRATSAATSDARSGIASTTTCSWRACAPSPTAPRPSSVGTPMPAVKLPSLPPPTATPCSGASPSSSASFWARANSSADDAASIGGRLSPPPIVSDVPAIDGRNAADRASSTRCEFGGGLAADVDFGHRRVRHDVAGGARVRGGRRHGGAKRRVADASRRRCSASASASNALAPFSGSRPACAARPANLEAVHADALARRLQRAVRRRFEHERSRCARAPCPRRARATTANRSPRRSSTSSVTPSRSSSDANAYRPWTRPAFMSKQPGPRARPSSTANGNSASVPSGHTVSRWPTSTHLRRRRPNRQRKCVAPSTLDAFGRRARRAPPTPRRRRARRRNGHSRLVRRRRLDRDETLERRRASPALV